MAATSAAPESRGPMGGRVLAGMALLVLGGLAGIIAWLLLSGAPAPVVTIVPVPAVPKPVAPEPTPEPVPNPEPAVVAPTVPAAPPIGQPPSFNEGRALLPAPDRDLIEKTPVGFLPVTGRDGRQPWQVYARPFDLSDKRPRIAVLIGNLGISPTATDNAINQLPAPVTLAFVTFKRQLGEWINLARAAGHEVLLDLPMEPVEYPRADPGPNGLLTALTPEQNMGRLNWNMGQATGYVGLVGYMGSRFSTSRDDMLPLLQTMKRRGLLYVDNRAAPQTAVPGIANEIGLPTTSANRLLDSDPTRAAVDKKLSELEDIARRNGGSLGLAQHADPVILERIGVWAQGLAERGLVLAPVSAVIDRPKPPEPTPTSEKPVATGAKAKPEAVPTPSPTPDRDHE
jgi:polysaccharide deacetylase 2 family uncharacterized protein YibQ